jgi:D-sedoheptulose 7-phosphate isomerase
MSDLLKQLEEHRELFSQLDELLENELVRLGEMAAGTLEAGGCIYAFGNGGSAADAQHLASEIVGRFEVERKGLSAVALTTDASVLTSLANDYGYDMIFARQVEALAGPGDLVIGISTSGHSPNVLRGLEAARQSGCHTAALLGCDGGPAVALADVSLIAPHDRTTRIQEVHVFIIHLLCSLIDKHFARE